MSKSNTLSNYKYLPSNHEAMHSTDPSRIILSVRQQPTQARSSTNNERDRRPIDPPPIIQIELADSNVQELQHFLQKPFLFMSVILVDSVNFDQVKSGPINTLSGQTTSSMYKLKDINNQDGGFFVFGDLSVKLEGEFRLKFCMFEINSLGASNLKCIYSDAFQVYSSKNFPGMLESTFLSRSFSDQGARIRIRKEHRVQMLSSRKRKLSPESEPMDQVYQKKGDTTHNQNMLVERQYHTPNQLPYSPHRTYQENEQQKEKEMVFYSREKNLIEPLSSGIQACIPFSPPHQYYDPYLARSSGTATDFSKQAYYHHQHAQNSFLSPPSQSTSLQKQEQYRRSSDPFKRIVGDTRYMGVGNSQRRMSLQSYHQPQYSSYPPDSGPVHLPPLRSVVPSATLEILPPIPKHKQTGEVDAAVAMIQLASLRKPRKTASLSLW